jgi:uncharacterized membrane protein YfcA
LFNFLFFLTAFFAELIGTVGGFGSSVFFVPLAALFFSMQTVLALTSILHVFSNAAKLLLFRKHVDYKLLLLMGLPSILLVIVGAHFSTWMDFRYSSLILGAFLIVLSSLLYIYPDLRIPPLRSNAIICGGIAGFLAGLIGTGGAIRGLTLAAFNLEKSIFVATSAAIDLGVDLSRMVVYLENDFLQPQYYPYIPVLFLIAFAGSFAGRLILKRIEQRDFRKIVLILIFSIGIVSLFQFFQSLA